jgi:DedD protein
MEQGVKNLEQIQETDADTRPGKGTTLAFVALGGACVLFAALALTGRGSRPDVKKTDPLGELVLQKTKSDKANGAPKPTELSTKDVTFPGILSDDNSPPTALAAVRGNKDTSPLAGVRAPEMPPPASDRLPVVPLPAANLLEATPMVTRPRDALTRAASDNAQMKSVPEGPSAPQGKEGGYQLQVSSFRTREEAEGFATQLRARSHKAYVTEAHVAGRGTWFRVRIGPFASQHAAAQYRAGFEGREHVVPFIVPPQK